MAWHGMAKKAKKSSYMCAWHGMDFRMGHGFSAAWLWHGYGARHGMGMDYMDLSNFGWHGVAWHGAHAMPDPVFFTYS